MKITQDETLIVPPDWTWMTCCIPLALMLFPLAVADAQPTFPRIDIRLLLLILLCTFLHASVYYAISKDCLYVKVFGFSVKKIPWSEFSGATYLCNVKTIRGNRRPNCIVLSIKSALPFYGNTPEELQDYRKRNRGKYVLLNIPTGKDDLYISAIEDDMHQEIIR